MKEFDFDAAKQGAAVCTRAGLPARIICFDLKNAHPVIARVSSEPDRETIMEYWSDGCWYPACDESPQDLMMRDDDYRERLDRGDYETSSASHESLRIGLSRRSWFAGLAMEGILASDIEQQAGAPETAKVAVEYADALIAELNKMEAK